jgi:hypothetical protein
MTFSKEANNISNITDAKRIEYSVTFMLMSTFRLDDEIAV